MEIKHILFLCSIFSAGPQAVSEHGVVGEPSEGIGNGHFEISCYPNN